VASTGIATNLPSASGREIDEEELDFEEIGGLPVELINKSKAELRLLKALEGSGCEIKWCGK